MSADRSTVGRGVVVVVAGGDPPSPRAAIGLPAGSYVIAADSGLDHAVALGLGVDVVVGDLDSVNPETLAAAAERGVVVDRHPPAKDQTDLELALDVAVTRAPARILVVGGAGGRLDHLFAAGLLLAAERYAGIEVRAWFGPALLTVVREEAELDGQPGELVSLLPVGGPARGVRTEGLLYPLDDEDLPYGTSRGVSNELLGTICRVSLREGVLLAIQPAYGGSWT